MGGGRVADDLFAGVITGFAERLHEQGVAVTPERAVRFARAVDAAQPTTVPELYWLARTTLVTSHGQMETFDAVFNSVFRGVLSLSERTRPDESEPSSPSDPSRDPGSQEEGSAEASAAGSDITTATPGDAAESTLDDDAGALAAVSVSERLADRSFADCTEEELALLRRLVERLAVVPPPRLARRLRRHSSGRRMDVRATLRRSHRTGGDPMEVLKRSRAERPRRVLLIADVSGSMEPYARIYLHLMRSAVQALHAEAFVFATRLTRLTRALGHTQADAAYRRALEAAPDWSGGTRIGKALEAFLDEYGRRGVARGAVVVIVSDGWEVDSPDLVGVSMERLSRLAHHIIWVNPRKASTHYEPLAGGMAAALPFVDTFVSGHSLHAIEEVMEAIRLATNRSTLGSRTRVSA